MEGCWFNFLVRQRGLYWLLFYFGGNNHNATWLSFKSASVFGVDNWKTFTTLESCISQEVYQVGGEGSPRVFWNVPLMGILLWGLGSLTAMRPYRRYSDDDVAAVREKARRKL